MLYGNESVSVIINLIFQGSTFLDIKSNIHRLEYIDLFNSVVREGCVALHYSVHLFYDLSLSRKDIGARSVRFPHRFSVRPTRSGK